LKANFFNNYQKIQTMLSENVIPKATLTPEENEKYNQQAAQLATKYNTPRVHPLVFFHPETGEEIAVFLKEPSFMQKLSIADKTMQIGGLSAADELRELIVLKEESHPLAYTEHYTGDVIKMGINWHISQKLITVASKKNTPKSATQAPATVGA